jgi:uncharacterized protein
LPAPSRSGKGFVGLVVAELYFPACQSLKGKRMYLRRARDQVVRRFGASFAEIGYQDLWQRSKLLMAVASSDLQVLQTTVDGIRVYLDAQDWVLTSCRVEVVDVDG